MQPSEIDEQQFVEDNSNNSTPINSRCSKIKNIVIYNMHLITLSNFKHFKAQKNRNNEYFLVMIVI